MTCVTPPLDAECCFLWRTLYHSDASYDAIDVGGVIPVELALPMTAQT